MGVIFDTINKEAQAIANAHSDPEKEPLDVEGELAKLKKQTDKMKEASIKKMEAEYDAKTKALVPSLPVRIQKYRLERFNSTDVEKYGEDRIKKTLNMFIEEHMKETEGTNDQKSEKSEEQQLKDAIKENQNDIAKEKQEYEKRVTKAGDLNKIAGDNLKREAPKDFLLRARTMAQQAEHDIEQQTQEKEKAYKHQEDKINEQAKAQGYPKGAKDVEKYNKLLDKAAKKIVYVKRNIIEKINIEKNKIIQSAKLKIMSLLGL